MRENAVEIIFDKLIFYVERWTEQRTILFAPINEYIQ